MIGHRDILDVRAFFADEIEQRKQGGARPYIRKAEVAAERFERIVARLEAYECAEQVAEFDKVMGPPEAWKK